MNLLPLCVLRIFFFLILSFNFLSAVTFTLEEKDWIAKHPVVTFGADHSWAPYDFIDREGKHTGISADYLNLISQKSGLKFNVKTGI